MYWLRGTLLSATLMVAALAFTVDLLGSAYMNPPANWAMPGYWQTWAGTQPPQTYGLVYRQLLTTDGFYWAPPGLNYFEAVEPDPNYGPSLIDPTPTYPTLGGIK